MMPAVITTWQMPSHSPDLQFGDIHLWKFRLNGEADDDLLSQDEKQRAQRLRVKIKARAFLIARTRLRQILSQYLDMSPEAIAFDYNQNGKPLLPKTGVRFNLSHSGEWGLCAVAIGQDVGVDLEKIKPEVHFQPLAERFFSADENRWLQSTPSSRSRGNFYRLWTRKEAWLKGKGGGFSDLVLDLDPVHIAGTAKVAQGWWLGNLFVARGYVGALAVNGIVNRLTRWEWPAEKSQAWS